MRFNKILMLFFILSLVVACAGKKKDSEIESEDVGTVETTNVVENRNVKNVGDSRVYFDFDKFDLKPEAIKILNEQAKSLKSDVNKKVRIEGHCDERGTREYNYALGGRRADAVKRYLVGKGVAPARIKTISYGKDRPQVAGSGEAVWAKNRVAITVEQ